MNEWKRYANAISRALQVDSKTKQRLLNDLASDLQSRKEAGQTLEEVQAELGTPEQLAAQLNAEFGRPATAASPWRWLVLSILVALVVWLVTASILRIQGQSGTINIIGAAQGSSAAFVNTKIGVSPSFLGLLPYYLVLMCCFMLLGWCRKAKARRMLPIILCAAVALVCTLVAVQQSAVFYMLDSAVGVGAAIWAALTSICTNGALAAALVLLWAIHDYRHSGQA